MNIKENAIDGLVWKIMQRNPRHRVSISGNKSSQATFP